MRFGCATAETSRLETLAAIGFDFAELRTRALAPLRDEVTFATVLQRVREATIPVEAISGVIPPFVTLPIVGPTVDKTRLLGHIQMVLDRAAALGVTMVVFGSGSARSVPVGFPKDRALAQLRDFVATCADLCAARRMTLAVEFLNREETNLVNTIEEAAALVSQTNRPNVGISLDCYHVLTGEGPSAYRSEQMRLVRHVHMSDENRRPPAPSEVQAAAMSGLRAAGYDARVTIEARFDDFESEARSALDYLRECWALSAPK